MKMLLHIILLLAIASSVTSISKKDQKAIADKLNVVRADYAKMNDIGNMHEVKFDEDLLRIAVRIANCEDLKGGIDIVKKSELEETSTNSGAVPMHLLPMRTEIACVQNLLTCTKFSEPICLLAPYTTEKQIKRGSIGSKCTNGEVERKLCQAKPPASSVRRFRDLA